MLNERLKNIRNERKMTQEQLAAKVQTTKGTISNYENGYSTPSNKMILLLSDVLGCTSDYLLGRTDNPTPSQNDREQDQTEPTELSKNLKLLRIQKRKTQDEMAELLGITRQAYGYYESGFRNPDWKSLCTLADYYDVTLDYLVGRTTIPNIYKEVNFSEYEDQLIKKKATELLKKLLDEMSNS